MFVLFDFMVVEQAVDHDSGYALVTKNNVMLINKQPISDFYLQDGEVLTLIRMSKW